MKIVLTLNKTKSTLFELFSMIEDIGYNGVELLNTTDDLEILSENLRLFNIDCVGVRADSYYVATKKDDVVFYLKSLGCNRVILNNISNLSDFVFEDVIEEYNRMGIQMCYRNCEKDFGIMHNGKYSIIDELEKYNGKLKLDLDVYSMWRSGVDIIEFISKYYDKISIVHLTDGTVNEPSCFGSGIIDYRPIIKLLTENNISEMVIENTESNENIKKQIGILKAYL